MVPNIRFTYKVRIKKSLIW